MRSRLRRFFLRHVPLTLAGLFALLTVLAVGAYFVASSTAFENLVRKRLITSIENLTGGQADVASFHWRLLHLEAEADGVVIHGLEDPGEAPYARIDKLRVRLSILGFVSPQVRLRELEISGPSLHFIVYPDGSTNQPHPRKPRDSNRSVPETLFDLKAGHIAVEHGTVDYDDRAAVFDNQNRYAPFDFQANDVSFAMRYVDGFRDLYRIEAEAADLDLARSVPRGGGPVKGVVQATIDLERARLTLRSLRITAHAPGTQDRALDVNGVLDDFNHPRWQARAVGDLDMQLLEPLTGYGDSPNGIAHIDLMAGGRSGTFQIDGGVHVEGGSYLGAGITATGIALDAHVHADPRQLLITQIVARLRQGGQVEGAVALEPWLPVVTELNARPESVSSEDLRAGRNVLVREPIVSIPVNGKVAASFKGVSLDTVLDIVSSLPYKRLGIDARLNGPTSASWTNGDARTVAVTADFALSPSGQAPAGEAPASGVIDATYTQHNGAVDLRKLQLHMPGSELEAHGALGAYPIASPSALTVDFQSRNLGEFDTVLRSLGLKRNGRSGAAALPVALAGQADFHGSWTGSLVRPHLAGDLKATQLAIEMPAASGKSEQPQFVRLDSLEATGSYSPAQISVQHAQLSRGKSRIEFNGTLDASPGSPSEFDGDSVIHAHAEAVNVDVADVKPFLATDNVQNPPVAGVFDARIQANGPLHSLEGFGSVEMASANLYGEDVSHLSLQGSLSNHELNLKSAAFNEAGGAFSASGSYDTESRKFQLDVRGNGIQVSQIGWVHDRNLDAAGKLGFSLNGSGTLDDPRLEGHATVGDVVLAGQRFGAFDVTAHTLGHNLAYTASTQLEGTELSVRGQTELRGDFATHAQLDFSQFNVGALFKMAHIEAFGGESALAGTVTLEGPLKHPEQLRGDARLQQIAMTISGVKLQGEGGAHATLANDRIQLDPLHVTGADTDLHAQGSLSLDGNRKLDVAASGSINLKLAETLDPDLTASGDTTFQVEAHGPLQHPALQGRIDIQNGSLSLEDLPNGLSQLNGEMEFTQNRLEVRTLTAMSGGGLLSVSGFLAYQHGIYADLSATGKEVRIRYPQGVSSLADARLQLQGPQNNLQLSGNVTITRFAISPDLDLAALAATASASVQAVAPPDAPSNHVRLDVHIVSSPQLSFQNAFAKLVGDVDLRLRGTLASPSLLGSVSVTQGSAMIAGTRYDLERGDITFTNPVRIEPNIDLSATAHVEDYDISLDLHGSPQKLAVTYRSDPPLPESDVVSLLALGHTANQQRLYTQQQEQMIANPTTDALLGGALNATVSNRIQKLFGAGSVKVDPNYLGAFGNSTSRVTVEEQLGRNVTLTYATDINTTSQQLLQAEVAINRHVSLVVARDESGVFSMVVKATRRYR
jgi:translocation and assembly module TamB